MTAQELQKKIRTALLSFLPEPEVGSTEIWLLESIAGLSRLELITNPAIDWSEAREARLSAVLRRLAQQEPLQYILEEAWFYGRRFKVAPGVLIPRPETEELVYWALEVLTPGAQVLDVGTGSGCIPITLQLEEPSLQVTSLDVSLDALQIAGTNANTLQATVAFMHADILTTNQSFAKLDLIISNPPYVRELERKEMQANVLEFEPDLALFVPNEDPLQFYRAIAKQGLHWLKPGGSILFEINEALGNETAELLSALGYEHPELRQDLQGKDRMLKGQIPLQKTTSPAD